MSDVYLITGANKGIGRAMVTKLLARASTTVVAGVRNPADPTSASLSDLPLGSGSRLVLVQLRDPADFAALRETLAQIQPPVLHVTTAIANAGHSDSLDRGLLETTPDDLMADFAVNSVGPLRLFQTVWPLLRGKKTEAEVEIKAGAENKAETKKATPKFILVSSSAASIATLDDEVLPGSIAYGMSKAAANWFAKRVAVEYKDKGLTVGVLHPGWVQTSMGQKVADLVGIAEPPMTVDVCAERCLDQIDGWMIDQTGMFKNYKGEEMLW